MNLYNLFFDAERRSTALIGGGGKTTLMAGIAEDAQKMKQPLVLSTSTKLQCPCPILSAVLLEDLNPPEEKHTAPGMPPVLWVGGKTPEGDKWIGPPVDTLEAFISRQSSSGELRVLVEADGSAGRPIKTPGPGEPVIPRGIATVAALIGISALGRPVSGKTVHRMEPFLRITGASPGETISTEMLIQLISHPEGSFKGTAPGIRRILVLNQADTPLQVRHGHTIAEAVIDAASGSQMTIDTAVICSLRKDYKIWSIINT